MRKIILPLILLLVTSCAGTLKFEKLSSYDLPDWKNFRGDHQNTAYVPSTIGVPDKLLWKYDAKRPLKSSPIVVGKIVVIGSLDKRVHFLHALSGKDLWVKEVATYFSTAS